MAKDRTLGLKLKAIDRMSTTLDKVQKKFPKLNRSVKRASRTFKIFNAQSKGMRQTLQKIGGGMKKVGTAITLGVTLPLAAAGAQGVKSFGDFQQGLRGVEKTTGLSRSAVEKLGMKFDQLSTTIPVTTAEMLELTQAGGQLGVKGSANLEKFTTTMAKLGRASDVAGEDGAKSIARILTVTGDGIGKIDRFSSALVDLGNNAAAGEGEILEVANRVAGQIGRFDVASDKVLGISTALKALGKNAESAGSVVGRSFDAIDQAIKGGGQEAQLLSKLTGIATKDLKDQFQKDAASVFQKFVGGLNKVESGGGNLIKVMAGLGLQGVRINDILGTLAKNPKVLAENVDRATKAFKSNTALQKEFEVQTDSFNSEMQTLTNTFMSLLRLLGKSLAPAVKFLGSVLKGVFNFLRENPVIRNLVLVFGGLLAVLGPVLTILGGFIAIFPMLVAGMAAFSAASLPITGTALLIGGAIVGLIALITILVTKWDEIKQAMLTNPFLQPIAFVMTMVEALGKLIGFVAFALTNLNKLSAVGDAFKDLFNFGDDKEGPLGASKGVAKRNRGLIEGVGRREDTVNGQINVDFNNAPKGTKVKMTSAGPLGFNIGLAGGMQ